MKYEPLKYGNELMALVRRHPALQKWPNDVYNSLIEDIKTHAKLTYEDGYKEGLKDGKKK